ncbi:MAG: 50S ribosome-binding GTPase [Synergistaceae bacterium]|nr:50S ribosome-binding GTPase [Synergistaceae bacterium]MBR0035444.1 50S ribosome-binding GTPase [Synergistaceae bacterium]
MLSTSDIETLGRLTGSDMVNRWKGLIKKLANGRKITIANTGLYSSGKSSLFNALLGRVREEDIRFPVGRAPTTKTGDRETLAENIELLDTPGIDTADMKDDATAFDMLMQSDVILMTHSLSFGPVNEAERQWLVRVAGAMSRESLQERLIFVMTCVDEVDDYELQKLRAEIRSQVTGIVGNSAIRFAEVSANMYKAGVEADEQELRNASGITELKELVIHTGMFCGQKAASLRRQELMSLCSQSRDRLNGRRREVSSELDSRKRRVRERYSGAFEKWRGILSRFMSMRSGVEGKLRECESIQSDYSFKSRIMDM